MRGDQWRPLAAFALVTVLCAVLMVVSATGGFGLDLFRPGKPIVAPRASQPVAPRSTPVAPAPTTMPSELSALPLAAMATGGTAPLLAPSAPDGAGGRDAGVATGTDVGDVSAEVAPATASDPAANEDASAARDEEKAQREAEREAAKAARDEEKAQREAEREAAKAARDEEKAQREAEREAEKAARDEEKAQREAEREAEKPHDDRLRPMVQTGGELLASSSGAGPVPPVCGRQSASWRAGWGPSWASPWRRCSAWSCPGRGPGASTWVTSSTRAGRSPAP